MVHNAISAARINRAAEIAAPGMPRRHLAERSPSLLWRRKGRGSRLVIAVIGGPDPAASVSPRRAGETGPVASHQPGDDRSAD